MRCAVLLVAMVGCSFTPPKGTGSGDVDAPAAEGAPGAPQNVAAQPSDKQIAVSWEAPLDNGTTPITSYRVTATPDDPALGAATCMSTPSSLACIVTPVDYGVTYSVRVVAVNDSGPGTPSAAALAMVIPDLLMSSKLWLDATVQTTLTVSDGTITRWADRLGGAFDATTGGGRTPKLEQVTFGATTMPAITFDGFDDMMVTPDQMIDGSRTYTFAAIAADRRNMAGPMDALYSTAECGLASGGFVAFLGDDVQRQSRNPGAFSSNSTVNMIRVNRGAPVVVPQNQPKTGSAITKDKWFVWTHQVQAQTGGLADRALRIGAVDNICLHAAASFGELVVFERTLTSGQIDAIEEYLFHKWRVIP